MKLLGKNSIAENAVVGIGLLMAMWPLWLLLAFLMSLPGFRRLVFGI